MEPATFSDNFCPCPALPCPALPCPAELSKIPTVLFGTINGVIGVVASLPQAQFQLLEALQV